VTGAAQGIGRAIALALAEDGARVAVGDLQEDAGGAVVAEIEAAGGRAHFVRVDLRLRDDLRAMVESTAEAFGGLDILVNNARPRLRAARFPDGLDEWDAAREVLLDAPVFATAYAVPFLERRGGVVLNVASTNAFLISQQAASYHTAKAALLHFTRAAAVDLGPRGIRVNAICPGLVDIEDRVAPLSANPTYRKVIEAIVPLGRAATSAEVGRLAAILCSDHARYYSGQAIVLDGGESILDQFAAATEALRAFGITADP
jgi:glucose 1-dehydrogenase